MEDQGLYPRFLAFDFYCGAGGATRGLLDAGGYVVAGVDNDLTCRSTYVSNNTNTKLDRVAPVFLAMDMFPKSQDYMRGEQHLIELRLRELIPKYRNLAPNVPLLFTICAPCQSFTQYVQRSISNDRSVERQREQHLLSQSLKFIEIFRPELLISENVAGIRSSKFGSIWSDFQSSLRSLGYLVGEGIVCASRFGVPQRRRRSVLMALLKSKNTNFGFNVLPIPSQDPDASMATAREAIGHLPVLKAGESSDEVPNHVCRDLMDINRKRLQSLKPGESNHKLSTSPFGDLTLPCHRRLQAKGLRGFSDAYTRMEGDGPSPTITTRFHSISNGRFGHFDEQQIRGLSLREGALLQSFGSQYLFHAEGMDDVARMIGNAVPPRLVEFLSKWLLGLWGDSRA